MLTTVEFFDDGTATYKPGVYGAVQTVKWKMTDSSTVQLYDFKYAPTYKTYTFKQFPTVGDEVDRTQMLNERLSEDSTFLVNRYRTL